MQTAEINVLEEIELDNPEVANYLGIEREKEYCELTMKRLEMEGII